MKINYTKSYKNHFPEFDFNEEYCKKRMNLATNNGNTWSDKTVLFGH